MRDSSPAPHLREKLLLRILPGVVGATLLSALSGCLVYALPESPGKRVGIESCCTQWTVPEALTGPLKDKSPHCVLSLLQHWAQAGREALVSACGLGWFLSSQGPVLLGEQDSPLLWEAT